MDEKAATAEVIAKRLVEAITNFMMFVRVWEWRVSNKIDE